MLNQDGTDGRGAYSLASLCAGLPRERASLMKKIPRQLLRRDTHMKVREQHHVNEGMARGAWIWAKDMDTYLKMFAILSQGCFVLK